jgi:hypothetical protein
LISLDSSIFSFNSLGTDNVIVGIMNRPPLFDIFNTVYAHNAYKYLSFDSGDSR